MASPTRFLTVASNHINSLIDYVLDVKPYHTKLLQISEEHVFSDNVNVKLTEFDKHTIFLGADIVDPTVYAGTSRPTAISWQQTHISDGARALFTLPLVSRPKFFSHLSQEKFICGIDDDDQIIGLTGGAFSQRRWDGPGITRVYRNDEFLHEGVDFNISHGVFSFVTHPNSKWKRADNDHLTEFPQLDGTLRYDDLKKSFGSIINIAASTSNVEYEEWKLVCVDDTPLNIQLSVTGSSSGLIGIADFNVPFVHPSIEFTFTSTVGDLPGTEPVISVGNTFTLTPSEQITIHPTAPQETWSLIKVNPICLTKPVFFEGATLPGADPEIQVYARDLHATIKSSWEIEFLDSVTFELRAFEYGLPTLLPGYPKTLALIDGLSYKDDLIHFTFISSDRGFVANDRFVFNINEDKPTYKVLGSVSGWEADAEIGEWYWNGKIGFKVNPLEYFALAFTPSIATSLDGEEWTPVVSNGQVLTEVEFINSNNGFLVTGINSIIGASINGQDWDSDVNAIASDDQRSIVIGENGFIALTTIIDTNLDPSFDWFERNSRTTNDLNDITFIPDFFLNPPTGVFGLFAVVGDSGTIISSANGDSWALQTSGTVKNLNSIAWKALSSSSLIMVVVGEDGTILTSGDALTWNAVAAVTSEDLHEVEYIDELGIFIAIGGVGTILTSPNGLTWTVRTSGTNQRLNAVAYKPIDLIGPPALPNGKIVVIGDNGVVTVSYDGGVGWNVGVTPEFNDITFGDGLFVAVGGGPIPAEQFVKHTSVHPMAVPSVYEITFLDEDADFKYAKVVNNVLGYCKGLKMPKSISEDDPCFEIYNSPCVLWTDGFVSFKLIDSPRPFNRGDVVKIYTAAARTFDVEGAYDELPYEGTAYDVDVGEIRIPYAYLTEEFPLFHSHGTVILSSCTNGDIVTIDKAIYDNVSLKLHNVLASAAPLLDADSNDWIPLEFRYGDVTDINGNTTSTAEFSDLATTIDAYLATDPDYKVFSMRQPRYENTNRAASNILEFTEEFLQDYLVLGQTFTIRALPQESYGQVMRVKVTEGLRVYASVNLVLDDIITVLITDGDEFPEILFMETTGFLDYTESVDIAITEGGIIPLITGYDIFPYGVLAYDTKYVFGNISGVQEVPPGSGNYVYTGNPLDVINAGTTVVGAPGILIAEEPAESGGESAGASFSEGLTIVDSSISNTKVNTFYDINKYTTPIVPPVPIDGLLVQQDADEYVVTHNYTTGTPFLIVESVATPGVYLNPTPDTTPYSPTPTATSNVSLSFTVPPGTAPFRLRLV